MAGAIPASAESSQTVVKVGSATITLPIPEGFLDQEKELPQFRQILESFVYPKNRLIGSFLDKEDIRRLKDGKDASMDRYFMVQTPHASDTATMSAAQFEQAKGQVQNQFTSQIKTMRPEIQTLMNDAYSNVEKMTGMGMQMKLGETVPLGLFAETPSSLTFGLLTKSTLSVGGRSEEMTQVAGTVIALVKGKPLFLYAYATYRTPEDLEWVKAAAKQWQARLQELNR